MSPTTTDAITETFRHDIIYLQDIKARSIGNPILKSQLVDSDTVARISNIINAPLIGPSETPGDLTSDPQRVVAWQKMRLEAAQTLASLSYGSQEALDVLLTARVPELLVSALSNSDASTTSSLFPYSVLSDPSSVRVAFIRALGILAKHCAAFGSDGDWSLPPAVNWKDPHVAITIMMCKDALRFIFQESSLDILLPLLTHSEKQIRLYTARLISDGLAFSEHRRSVAEWMPPAERALEAKGKGKRGWERPEFQNQYAGGGWTSRALMEDVKNGDVKGCEAALLALAAIARDNVGVGGAMFLSPSMSTAAPPSPSTLMFPSFSNSPSSPLATNSHADTSPGALSRPPHRRASMSLSHTSRVGNITVLSTSPYASIIGLTQSKNMDLLLAACLCVTNILRAMSVTSPHWSIEPPYTIVGILSAVLSDSNEPMKVRSKACFILNHFVRDDDDLEKMAARSASLKTLAVTLHELIPNPYTPWTSIDNATTQPDNSILLEAILTTLATLTLNQAEPRRSVLESNAQHPPVLSRVIRALSHPSVGVRYAACQCIRSLSRSVDVLKDGIGDVGSKNRTIVSGVRPPGIPGRVRSRRGEGNSVRELDLVGIIFDIVRNEDEDLRVKDIGLMCTANLVNDFPPTRQSLIQSGVVQTLPKLIGLGRESITQNSIWAVRNALYHASRSEIEAIMLAFGWDSFGSLLAHPAPRIRDMAAAALTNMLVDNSDLVMKNLPQVVDLLQSLIQPQETDIIVNALKALSNLAGSYASVIYTRLPLLRAIRTCVVHASSPAVRKAAVVCVLNLLHSCDERPANNILTGRDHLQGTEIDEVVEETIVIPILFPVPVPLPPSSIRGSDVRQAMKDAGMDSALRTLAAGTIADVPPGRGAHDSPGLGAGMYFGSYRSELESDDVTKKHARAALDLILGERSTCSVR